MIKALWRVFSFGIIFLCLSTVPLFAGRDNEGLLLPPAAIVLQNTSVSFFPGSNGNQKDILEGTRVFVLDRWEIDSESQGEMGLYYQIFNSSGVFGWINANRLRPEPYTLSPQDFFLLKSIDRDLKDYSEEKNKSAVRALRELSEIAQGAYLSSIINDILSLKIYMGLLVFGRERVIFKAPILYSIGQIENFSEYYPNHWHSYLGFLTAIADDPHALRATLEALSVDTRFKTPSNFKKVLREINGR